MIPEIHHDRSGVVENVKQTVGNVTGQHKELPLPLSACRNWGSRPHYIPQTFGIPFHAYIPQYKKESIRFEESILFVSAVFAFPVALDVLRQTQLAIARSEDLAYAAGLVDGEGCFYISTQKTTYATLHFQPMIKVTLKNTEPDLKALQFLKQTLGGALTTSKNSNTLLWYLYSQERLREVLPLIIPYLIIKKSEAMVLLDACNSLWRSVSKIGTKSPREVYEKMAVANDLLFKAKGKHYIRRRWTKEAILSFVDLFGSR